MDYEFWFKIISAFYLGYQLRKFEGYKKTLLYIGNNEEEYEKAEGAIIRILTK